MTNETEAPSKRGVIKSAIYLAACLGMIGLGVYVLIGGLILRGCQDHQDEKRLQHRNDYPAIADACARLLEQLGANESQSFSGTNASLPEAIRQLGPAYVSTSTNQVRITFGSHVHHWGLYYMETVNPTNSWRSLEFWADGSKRTHLWP